MQAEEKKKIQLQLFVCDFNANFYALVIQSVFTTDSVALPSTATTITVSFCLQ